MQSFVPKQERKRKTNKVSDIIQTLKRIGEFAAKKQNKDTMYALKQKICGISEVGVMSISLLF